MLEVFGSRTLDYHPIDKYTRTLQVFRMPSKHTRLYIDAYDSDVAQSIESFSDVPFLMFNYIRF